MRLSPISYQYDSDHEERASAQLRASLILSTLEDQSSGITKTASANAVADLLVAIAKILGENGITTNLSKGSDLAELAKTAVSSKDAGEEDHPGETIRIASKQIQDSHYFIDISSDTVSKNDRSLVMVSFLMREGYLGRYLIKRNFFYLPSHSSEASETYRELVRKARRVRDRYHSAAIGTYDVLPEAKAFLDGIKGDFEDKLENDLGTTVKRDKERFHEASGPPYIGYSGHK